MAFSENAVRILKERYLNRDKDGNVIETVDELFHRVAVKRSMSYMQVNSIR